MTHNEFEQKMADLQLSCKINWSIENGATQSIIQYNYKDVNFEIGFDELDYNSIIEYGKDLINKVNH